MELPRMFASQAQAEAVGGATSSVRSATTSVSILNIIMMFGMKASLNQLWSLINAQQLTLNMPLMKKLKFPANAALVNEEMIQFAFFDLIPTDWLDEILIYLPEGQPYSSNW